MGYENCGRLAGNERRDFTELIKKSYNYLVTNFSKFRPEIRRQLSLEIIKKAMPSAVEHSGDIGGKDTNIIIIKSDGDKIETGNSTKAVSREIPAQH